MKVAALVHFATPWRNAGSETVLHLMLRELVRAGHEVRCYVTDCPGHRETIYDGVHLIPLRNVSVGLAALRRWKPEVTISHHQNAALTMRRNSGREVLGKTVYLTHNDMDVNKTPLSLNPDLVVHNSQWVRDSLQRFRSPDDGGAASREIVVHPPLDCERHRVGGEVPVGDALTLINLNEHKGAKIVYGLAERMHDQRFVAVLGGHGNQIKPPRHLSNVTLVQHSPDLKPVWAQTRLLLMPSIYESYGLVGVEAGCSGIPTLANDTPGLRESLGPAGLFISERDNLDEWESAIREIVGHDEGYRQASKASRANSEHLCEQTRTDLGRFVSEVEGLVG